MKVASDNSKTVENTLLPQRSQFTVFHVLWLSFVFICAYLAGRKLAIYWGKAGWVVGALVGVACGFLLFHAFWLLATLYQRFRPLRPPCRQGRCRSNDYEIRVIAKEGSWESESKCKCGDMYVRRGNRFMLLRADGSTHPYMLRRRFHNWETDKLA